MLADMRLAMVPASMARRPRRARSLRRLGTRAPMPPICMPILPTLANPQRAKVAMENVRGSRTDLSLPSSVKATNSFDHGAGAEEVADGCGNRARGCRLARLRRCSYYAEDGVERVGEGDAVICAGHVYGPGEV